MVGFIRHYFPLSTLFLVALDAVCLFFAILFGYMALYPGGSEALIGSVPGAISIVLAMVILTGALGLYRNNPPDRFWPIVSRVTLAFLVVLPGLHWIFYRLPDGSVCFPCLAATLLLGFGGKIAIFLFSRVSPLTHRRVMILGVGSDAVAVKETLDKSRIRGLSIVGFYSPYADQAVDASLPASKILPSSKSIGETTGQHNVSEIVIAMRERRGGALPLTELLNCKLRGVKVTDLSSFFEQHRSKVQIDLLRESWFIFGDGFRQGKFRMIVKRTFDIVASGVLLVLSLPVMLFAALAIKLDSPGPIIYRQERVGLGGRTFNILKFRSMRTDAEMNGKPQWAQTGDSRVTKVGRFMRLTRIDELPQLLTVLAGQMSLVGPRPERPYFVEQLVTQVPFYAARHSVKPGLTGWAQVRHKYGASIDDAADKLEYDLYYVKNHRLLFDILILFYSVRVVLLAQGSR
ncbi:MAG: TIGR03013 family PEP-CTERM/XrtA system glycosyltransferase [Betaproteobacteria bacterium]|nr:TIGR03013 family PEP-CTERM/XrtA system glycosyltransferase [Betaproteobacteria bacterium]